MRIHVKLVMLSAFGDPESLPKLADQYLRLRNTAHEGPSTTWSSSHRLQAQEIEVSLCKIIMRITENWSFVI
jgi:hypothetical protein